MHRSNFRIFFGVLGRINLNASGQNERGCGTHKHFHPARAVARFSRRSAVHLPDKSGIRRDQFAFWLGRFHCRSVASVCCGIWRNRFFYRLMERCGKFFRKSHIFFQLFSSSELGETVSAFQFATTFIGTGAFVDDFASQTFHRFPANLTWNNNMMLLAVLLVLLPKLYQLLPSSFCAAIWLTAGRTFIRRSRRKFSVANTTMFYHRFIP